MDTDGSKRLQSETKFQTMIKMLVKENEKIVLTDDGIEWLRNHLISRLYDYDLTVRGAGLYNEMLEVLGRE